MARRRGWVLREGGAAAGSYPAARWVLGTPALAGAGRPEDDGGGGTASAGSFPQNMKSTSLALIRAATHACLK